MGSFSQAPPVGLATQEPNQRAINLPLVFQEALTVIVRLRANRQPVGDPEVFRRQIATSLKEAEQEGLRLGYTLEDMRVGTFAVVAFLDESILNSQNPIFADWARKPLQEELFGVHIAGEIFFRNVERLLGRQDSQALADLLEVHQLCLLLGFRGRYSATGRAEIRAILSQIEEKIGRIRVPRPSTWQIAPERIVTPKDPWIPRLKWILISVASLSVFLFILYKVLLMLSVGDLETLATRVAF